MTANRSRRVIENDEFAGFVRRVVRAHGRRVGTGDVEALVDLLTLSEHIDAVIGDAVRGLRAFGYSWSEIALRLGVSRQAVQKRWGKGGGCRAAD